MTATPVTKASLDPSTLQRLLDGPYAEIRELVRERLSRPDFAPVIALPTSDYRERVLEWGRRSPPKAETALGFPVEYGGAGNPAANVASFEVLALGDLSLLVKVGVQFGLWGGVIQQLGTKVHHDRYLKASPRDQFGELNPVGLVTFVASQVVETVLERLCARKLAQVISDVVPKGDENRNLLDRARWPIASSAGSPTAMTRSRSSEPSRTTPSTPPAPTPIA